MRHSGAWPAIASESAPPRPSGEVWKILVLAAPLPFLFGGTFATLWSVWWNNPNYSHGLLVPAIAALLVWARRGRLRSLPRHPSGWGLPLVGVGVGMQILGIRGDVTFLQGYASLAVLAGLILHAGGRGWLRALGFPLAFLAFMLPAPPFLMNQVSFGLKQLVSLISTELLAGLGIPVWRRGALLYLPAGPLAVENPCSGLRSLLALLALGALVARSGEVRAWKRIALFLAAWPTAVAANILRVVILALAATFFSLELAVGRVHDVLGFLLFLAALGFLEIARRCLRWRRRTG